MQSTLMIRGARLMAVLGVVSIGLSARALAAESFTFTLENAGNTSAGVFAQDGTLVKTLWSRSHFLAGSHTREWDGTTDEGVLAAKGSYQVRVLTSQTKYTWQGVIGNTSTQTSGPTVFHYRSTIGGMATWGDTAYIVTGENEQLPSRGKFSMSQPGGKTPIGTKGSWFYKVATDGNYVYWAARDQGIDQGYVTATITGLDSEVCFGNNTKRNTASGNVSVIDYLDDSCNRQVTDDCVTAMITGLAVQKTHRHLFVARRRMNSVHVLDKLTGEFIRSVPFTAPGDLAVDDQDNLWMIHTVDGTVVVQRFSVSETDGQLSSASQPIINSGLQRPLAIASQGTTLLVVDGGASQQVKAFDENGASIWSLGQLGGYNGDPAVADSKFDFEPKLEQVNDTFIAFQDGGSFWVGDPGNYRVQHFPAGTPVDGVLPVLGKVSYIPAFYSAAVDANDSSRVFADFLEFQVSYGPWTDPASFPIDPARPERGAWKLIRNWRKDLGVHDNKYLRMKYATTLDCSTPGRGGKCTYAVIGKKLYELVLASGLRDTSEVFEADVALASNGSLYKVSFPCLQPLKQSWERRNFIEVDMAGNPTWTAYSPLASLQYTSLDPWIGGTGYTMRPGVKTSSDILVSFDPMPSHTFCGVEHRGGWHLGGVTMEGENARWRWKASPSTPITYKGGWPNDGTFDIANGVQMAGGVPMTANRHILYGYPGENWHGIQTNKWRHYYDDGLLVDEFGKTAFEEGNPEAGAELAGNAANSSLVKFGDDKAYLYHNDESIHGGVHRWLIEGLNTVAEETLAVEWQPELQPGLLGEYFNSADWNSAQRKASALAPIIDGPPYSGFTQGNAPSARWTGYVLPQYSESYTFEVVTNDWARLWVGGKQILVGAGTQTSVEVPLRAGVYIPIRLEYRRGSAGYNVKLKWSSPSRPSQVVPSERLGWLVPGTNLQVGLPSEGTLTSGAAPGWIRTPAEDQTDEFHYWRVASEESGDNRFLSVSFLETTPGSVKTVTRDLGPVDGTVARWEINSMMSWRYLNHDSGCGQRVEVLDDDGKVVANFYATMLSYPDDARILGNGVVVAQSDVASMEDNLPEWQPLRITGENGQIKFDYGGYASVTAPIVDTTANWRRIKTFRLYYWSNGSWCGYPSEIKLDDLRVATTNSAGAAVDLLEGLPPATAKVTSGEYGWTFSPSQKKWWDVSTNLMSWQTTGSVDLGIEYGLSYGSHATVSRDLGIPSGNTRRWQLSGLIRMDLGNIDGRGSQYIDVLDDAGKSIVRFHKYVGVSGPVSIHVNDGAIPGYTEEFWTKAWSPLDISAEADELTGAGTVTFRYGNAAPITKPVFAGGAAWNRPKTLRISSETALQENNFSSRVYFDELKFMTTTTSSSGVPIVSTSETRYVPGASIAVAYSSLPGSTTDWIAVAPVGSPSTSFTSYVYSGGHPSGMVTLPAPSAAGSYVVRGFPNNTYSLLAESSPFSVGAALPAVSTYLPKYSPGESITVTYSNLPGGPTDWLGIAVAGSASTSYLTYVYTGGQQSGTATLMAPSAGGSYVVRAFPNNTFNMLAEAAFSVSVAPTMSTNAATYAPGATITVTYANLPGNPTDWIGVAVEGSPSTSYISYVYTGGNKNGVTTLAAPAAVGSYVIRAFPNATYNIVAEEAFSVKDP